MHESRNISLPRDEWDAFEKRINTFDAERARRANAFLHQYETTVSVRREANKTEIMIPWLDDSRMLELLGIEEEKPEETVAKMVFQGLSVDIKVEKTYLSYIQEDSITEQATMYSHSLFSADAKQTQYSTQSREEPLKAA